tara:strand:+ start:11618 stop:13018 length:1401 start_codon:yes stop_codon:yes gene_type:complete
MLQNIHFYDTTTIGTPGLGQPVSFHSIIYEEGRGATFDTAIALRPDVQFHCKDVETSPVFDEKFLTPINEYEWSRIAEKIFSKPNTLHIGFGSTSRQDDFIRYALYRCLSTLPSTDNLENTYHLDLLTVYRAFALLRPKQLHLSLPLANTQAAYSSLLFQYPSTSRADTVKQLTAELQLGNPNLFNYALRNCSRERMTETCGLVDGRVETISSLQPVFVTHESIPSKNHYGFFMTMGTDPQYPNILYMVDLEADLTDLIDETNDFSGFIHTKPEHQGRPIIRVNLNRSPFICPLRNVGAEAASRLNVDMALVRNNETMLRLKDDLCLELMEHSSSSETARSADPDFQLYGPEYLPADKLLLNKIHSSEFDDWLEILKKANDPRIQILGMRLIRRFAKPLLGEEETKRWGAHCAGRLAGNLDDRRLSESTKYCREILDTPNAPSGMRETARHWIQLVESRNELSSQI